MGQALYGCPAIQVDSDYLYISQDPLGTSNVHIWWVGGGGVCAALWDGVWDTSGSERRVVLREAR